MVPTSYTEVALFMLLAVGAALVLGTGGALMRYRRTGLFPGETFDADALDEPPPLPSRDPRVRSALVKLGVGVVMLVWGVGALAVVRDVL
jgi:hypothetical protein